MPAGFFSRLVVGRACRTLLNTVKDKKYRKKMKKNALDAHLKDFFIIFALVKRVPVVGTSETHKLKRRSQRLT